MSDYFSSWRDRGFTCGRCAWTGTAEEASHELFAELFEVNCPQCDARLDLVLLPTDASIRRAAKQGHPEAQEMLSKFTKDPEGEA